MTVLLLIMYVLQQRFSDCSGPRTNTDFQPVAE